MASNDSGRRLLVGASLALGVTSIALVFGIGLCAVVGARQGWLRIAATPLYICGASSAFLGLIAVVLSLGGFFRSIFEASRRGRAAVGRRRRMLILCGAAYDFGLKR